MSVFRRAVSRVTAAFSHAKERVVGVSREKIAAQELKNLPGLTTQTERNHTGISRLTLHLPNSIPHSEQLQTKHRVTTFLYAHFYHKGLRMRTPGSGPVIASPYTAAAPHDLEIVEAMDPRQIVFGAHTPAGQRALSRLHEAIKTELGFTRTHGAS